MNRKHIVLLALGLLTILALLFTIYLLGSSLEKRRQEQRTVHDNITIPPIQHQEVIDYNGSKYVKRRGLTSFLIVGTNNEQPDHFTDSFGFRFGGQVEFLTVVIVDHNKKELYRINIDKNTVTDGTLFNALGKLKEADKSLIAFAPRYGKTAESSAQLTMQAVENLFQSLKLDFYVVFTTDAIKAMNDAVGGVTVQLHEDLTDVDPAFVQGMSVQLSGEHAVHYIKARKTENEETFLKQINRQNIFLSAFLNKVSVLISQDSKQINQITKALSPYFKSNIGIGQIMLEFNRIRGYYIIDYFVFRGNPNLNEGSCGEFIINENVIAEILLEIFCEPMLNN